MSGTSPSIDHRVSRASPWCHGDGRPLTGAGVTVAVIDSGWDRTQNDARIGPGAGFVDPDDDFACRWSEDDHDRLGHGTLCANLLLRVAPEARVLPARVFGKRLETSPETIGTAIDWAVQRRARVINLSLATRREDARDQLYAACARACAAGVILVAAVAGDDIAYPSAFDLVVSVDVADWDDPFVYSFAPDDVVECRSPGRRRLSTGLGGKSVVVSGTSFAAPNIAGIAALWIERWPDLDLAGLRGKLAEHARQ